MRPWWISRHAHMALLSLLTLAPQAAQAALPGLNGRTAYAQGGPEGGLYVTGLGRIAFNNGGDQVIELAWSPSGSRIAFTRSGPYRLLVMNQDGSQQQLRVHADQLGATILRYPTWDPVGQRLSFYVVDGPNIGIWSVPANGGSPTVTLQDETTNSVSGLNWSKDGKLVYGCAFRPGHWDLCVYTPPSSPEDISVTSLLPIDYEDYGSPTYPNWSPDGKKIIFTMYRFVGQMFERHIFSVRANGSDVTQLTPRTEINDCTGTSATYGFYFHPNYSPDGSTIVTQGYGGLYTLPASGGPGQCFIPEPPLSGIGSPDWQPLPADLTVHVEDGHENELAGLKVELCSQAGCPPEGTLVEDQPVNVGGDYLFEDVPAGEYAIRVTLVDYVGAAFDVRHADVPGEPVWILVPHTQDGSGMPQQKRVHFAATPDLTTTNAPLNATFQLDDMANIYFRTRQFVDWVKESVTSDTGPMVSFYTFATVDPIDGGPLPARTYYRGNAVIINVNQSEYENRDGVADLTHADDDPENGEWHEFTHHLGNTFINPAVCPGTNHGGYNNPDSCDSMDEGLAEFLPTLASRSIEGGTESYYNGMTDLEAPNKAWFYWQGTEFATGEFSPTQEDLAVASLFWDLTDDAMDDEVAKVVGADGQHHSVIYVDTTRMSVRDLWTQLTTHPNLDHPIRTVRDLRLSFGTVAPTIDLDGNTTLDIAPLDALFLMHGFFPIDGDETITPTHKTYHFDVGYLPGGPPPNAFVGLSSHRVYNTSGQIITTLIPREERPVQSRSSLDLQVLNPSGRPLSGATVDLQVGWPGGAESTRAVAVDGNGLVHLELPPYFSYLLPAGAPLPPCDPANDVQALVTLSARVSDVGSLETPTFDNCTYYHAMAAATGPAALAYTLTVPVYSLELTAAGTGSGTTMGGGTHPADSTIAVSATPVPGCSFGGWIGPDAAECATGSVVMNADKSCTAVFNDLDSDGDTLTDAYELSIGTDPSNPDTDGDGLRDDAELALGTNPASADTDGDGLYDGAELGRGTNPNDADSDHDGLSDGFEVGWNLDPLDPDGDDDGALDGSDKCRTVYNRLQRDSDGDGVGEVCDNCPQNSNANQSDTDGDGAGDACDCAPSNASKRAPGSPTVLASKSGSSIVLGWNAVAGADAYTITRGNRAGLAAGDFGSCFGSTGTTTFSDAEIPASGTLFLYLVQGQSYTCGSGSLGFGANEVQRTNFAAGACGPAVIVERLTVSETLVSGTLIAGTHLDTHSANNLGENIGEVSTGGNPSNRYGLLENRFVVNVAPGDVIELLVQGERSEPEDGDDFRFEWSTNGTTFTPISIGSLPFVPDGTVRVGPLPATLSGPVTIRVVDTVRTPGSDAFDWVWIDWLAVRSISF